MRRLRDSIITHSEASTERVKENVENQSHGAQPYLKIRCNVQILPSDFMMKYEVKLPALIT